MGKKAAHSAYNMFSWYKYLIVSLVFSHLGFWSGNPFLIAPFPDLCLRVPFHMEVEVCINGPGHMIKMAAMPIYGKDLEKSSFLESVDRLQ